jgi:hypothetical protein
VRNNTRVHAREIAAAHASAGVTEHRMIIAPKPAPANIASIETTRRANPGLLRPANDESAASRATVSVSTVVVRSWTESFRTAAFRTPIATAVNANSPRTLVGLSSSRRRIQSHTKPLPTTMRSPLRTHAAQIAGVFPRRLSPSCTTRNATRAVSERSKESPGTRAAANARNTTVPVVFAVSTRPRARKLVPSICSDGCHS